MDADCQFYYMLVHTLCIGSQAIYVFHGGVQEPRWLDAILLNVRRLDHPWKQTGMLNLCWKSAATRLYCCPPSGSDVEGKTNDVDDV